MPGLAKLSTGLDHVHLKNEWSNAIDTRDPKISLLYSTRFSPFLKPGAHITHNAAEPL